MDYIFLIVMTALCIIAYYMGRNDGANTQPSEEMFERLKKYEIDKRFEHMRWTAERRDMDGR